MEIVHLPPERWIEYKNIYLDELKNEPIAFLNSYEKMAEFPESHWKEILETRNNDIYFAQIGNQIVGMAGISYGTAPKNNHVVSIWGVYVKPAFRRQGIARSLMQQILKDMDYNPHILKVSLGAVITQIHAQRLYKSLGFEQTGLLKKEFLIDGNYYDELTFEKMIKESLV